MTIKVKFCGAAGMVTGSCYWITTSDKQFLVDCGLFQGNKTVKELNYQPFPFEPAKIDFVLLTHAHTDHTAQIPRLVKAGFDGPVYSTRATLDLVRYMLPDSGYIQEFEVARLNRRNLQRGKNAVEPIYTAADAEAAVTLFRSVEYGHWTEVSPDIRCRFWNAGHILGSASIEIEITDTSGSGAEKQRLLFSGDLGPSHKLFHDDPGAHAGYDYVFCESTYGGRDRLEVPINERRKILSREINDALNAGGNLIIPSFAVERSQELLLDIAWLLREGDIPCTSVFLDSPLAIKITSVFSDHAADLSNIGQVEDPFSHPHFRFTETAAESKSIGRLRGGAIILAASGMCDAGRVRHHLKEHLWRARSTVLLVGYQAEGTLGKLLEDGCKNVTIQGEKIKVRARIRTLDVYSGHADNDELVAWINAMQPIGKALFLTHGSREAIEALRREMASSGFPEDRIAVPALDDEFDLTAPEGAKEIKGVYRRIEKGFPEKFDWHNKLARFEIDIRQTLEDAPDDQHRVWLLSKLDSILKKSNSPPQKK